MSDSARRKEKQRLKRKQKQQALRKTKNAGLGRIFSTAAERGLPLECYCNANWRQQGMLSLICLRQLPTGRYAMAAFLIDLWCIGLKDAWGNPDLSREEFQTKILDRADQQMDRTPLDEEQARSLVAGAIRFSHKNGFRLPNRYERWTALLGGVGDIATADLSPFALPNGKLRFIGRMDDLQSRLIVGTVNDFFARPDVEYISELDDSYLEFHDEDEDVTDEDTDENDEEEGSGSYFDVEADLENIQVQGLATVRQWLLEHGRQPHPDLHVAFSIYAAGVMAATIQNENGDADTRIPQIDRLLSLFPAADRLSISEAIGQISEFASQFPTNRDLSLAFHVPL